MVLPENLISRFPPSLEGDRGTVDPSRSRQVREYNPGREFGFL